MKIYLDVSCLDRPFDDQSQERIRLEAEAVALILARVSSGQFEHVSSEMALIEVSAIPDAQRREKTRHLVLSARDIIPLSNPVYERAASLMRLGLKPADAVHVAAAEAVGAHVLLTCDDVLLRRCARLRRRLAVEVDNPLTWMRKQSDAQDT